MKCNSQTGINVKFLTQVAEMAKATKNRGAQRSQRLLTDAFFELLNENPHQKIQIKDICERADVSRPTFYAHYDKVEDIAQAYLDQWLDELGTSIQTRIAEEFPLKRMLPSVPTYMFTYWGTQSETVQLLKAANMEGVVLASLKKGFEAMEDELVTLRGGITDPEFKVLLMNHSMMTFYELYTYWIETDKKYTPEKMALIFIALIDGVREKITAILAD